MWKVPILLFLWSFQQIGAAVDLPPPCDSKIYCTSSDTSLLHTVQMARLYKDSKTFVDKPIKTSEQVVLNHFKTLMNETGNKPSKEQVQTFVDDNFDSEGSEFEDWEPSDWKPDIALLNNINDSRYKDFAADLHSRWQDLGRKIKSDVQANQEKYSLVFLDNPFVVPGGRFREMYYWDSYWTIQGLIVSEMYDTVKGMLSNFVQLIEKLGHIPNGNRIYYNRRTQPALFISMVDAYFEQTNDKKFIEDNIDALDKEFNYWIVNRTKSISKNGDTFQLARYNVEVDDPRPESYFEDYNDAQKLSSKDEQQEFYQNMKSGAESGWDYSTRWFFKEDGSPSEDLLDIKTRHIIPVDLNSYLCKNAATMAKFHKMLGHTDAAKKYEEYFDGFVTAIDKVLWNAEKGAWFDFDTLHNKSNLEFYPSNVAPLWAECYSQTRHKEKIKPVIKYMREHEAFQFPNGVPTSMVRSGQQWDFSNAWPPLQEIIVTGLEKTGDEDAQALALELVEKWVRNTYVSYEQSDKKMFEKYDVEQSGYPGGGGEYDVQEGFGWTNGVILHFLSKYGSLISPDTNPNTGQQLTVQFLPLVIGPLFYHLYW